MPKCENCGRLIADPATVAHVAAGEKPNYDFCYDREWRDITCLKGAFHQLELGPNYIVNGTLLPYDSYMKAPDATSD